MSVPVLVGLLAAIVAALYVVAPLIWPHTFGVEAPVPAPSATDETRSLRALRDEILAAIVDLDFENAVGKTDEEEYQEERSALKRRALTVIRTLDARVGGRAALDEKVEREIRDARARRGATSPPTLHENETPELYDEVERQISALRRARGAEAPAPNDRRPPVEERPYASPPVSSPPPARRAARGQPDRHARRARR